MPIEIEYVDKLHPIFTKPKRIKIVVGGRGSTKSTAVADHVIARLTQGELWCCARENQNSIEESVHRTILDEISRLGFEGFEDTKTSISYPSQGGRTFYRGLAGNITSLKSTLSGVDGLWIEEGEDISDNTLRVLTASVRLNAKDAERKIAGEDVKMPEIIITMNRGARTGAIARKWLARAEKDLQRCGYYEDDLIMVVQVNYTDMPKAWFEASGLEQERLDDLDKLSESAYRHKWLGDYLDEIENGLIKREWVEAAIDAHKIPRLEKMFEPIGAKIAAHDCSDTGNDSKGYALRHGSIIRRVLEKLDGEVDDGFDWALRNALDDGADLFTWDGDGMGAGAKRQVSDALKGTRTDYQIFKGSLSGSAQDNANQVYQPTEETGRGKNLKYYEVFVNNRAQYYVTLADKLYNTYRCVVKGEYVSPDEMISIDSEGVEHMDLLISELSRIPMKKHSGGLRQVMNKQEMKANKIESPNMADSVMMTMISPVSKQSLPPRPPPRKRHRA